ncbi:hypothetical protein Y027_4707 [Burkholderia pseudomallei TSV5]|nr:hypothetical protein Y027_4707 [Burkholderia pseudomallei TSV5]
MAANLSAIVTIQPGLSPVSPAFSKSFGDTRSLTRKALRPIQAFISKSPTRFALSGQTSTVCVDRKARRGAALRDLRGIRGVFWTGVSAMHPDRALLRGPQVSGRLKSGGPCV